MERDDLKCVGGREEAKKKKKRRRERSSVDNRDKLSFF